jgi:hypothetical protein
MIFNFFAIPADHPGKVATALMAIDAGTDGHAVKTSLAGLEWSVDSFDHRLNQVASGGINSVTGILEFKAKPL